MLQNITHAKTRPRENITDILNKKILAIDTLLASGSEEIKSWSREN